MQHDLSFRFSTGFVIEADETLSYMIYDLYHGFINPFGKDFSVVSTKIQHLVATDTDLKSKLLDTGLISYSPFGGLCIRFRLKGTKCDFLYDPNCFAVDWESFLRDHIKEVAKHLLINMDFETKSFFKKFSGEYEAVPYIYFTPWVIRKDYSERRKYDTSIEEIKERCTLSYSYGLYVYDGKVCLWAPDGFNGVRTYYLDLPDGTFNTTYKNRVQWFIDQYAPDLDIDNVMSVLPSTELDNDALVAILKDLSKQ